MASSAQNKNATRVGVFVLGFEFDSELPLSYKYPRTGHRGKARQFSRTEGAANLAAPIARSGGITLAGTGKRVAHFFERVIVPSSSPIDLMTVFLARGQCLQHRKDVCSLQF